MARIYVKNAWVNRTVPPLLLAAVVSCVWYSLDSRPPVRVATSAATVKPPPVSTETIKTSEQPAPVASPTVKHLGSQLQFSVAAVPYKDVQKVEFYVESQFVGTAYSQPYSVAVSENNLAAGTHTVTAKIYTASTTADSQPATFTAQPVTPPPVTPAPTEPAAPVTPPPASHITLDTPADVTATASDDGTSATLSWTASAGATQYQIWRDNVQVATASGTGYTDTGLNPGQTYDYQIIATGAGGAVSNPSPALAVTMPTPQDTGPVNTQPTDSKSSQSVQSQSPSETTDS